MEMPTNQPDTATEDAVDSLIDHYGGDARQAVFALLGERDYLMGRIEALEANVSWGFVRAGGERK
jgi:hypothetical protein